MIDVNFHGKWSWERRQLFSQAAEYFLSILLPKEYPYLCLDITLMQSKGISGWCTPYDKDYYNIEINKNRDIFVCFCTNGAISGAERISNYNNGETILGTDVVVFKIS